MKPHNWVKQKASPQDITVECSGCGLKGIKYPNSQSVMINRRQNDPPNLNSHSAYRPLFQDEHDCDQELVELVMEV